MAERKPNAKEIPVIGLVGGIGAGKSAVADELEELGCVVAHSDEHGRAALRDPGIRQQLMEWWGHDILDDAGEVDRSAVARIVFNDPEERARLERLTHPWIEQRRRELFAAASKDAIAFVIDAPLLLEAGLDSECDFVVFVEAAEETRQARVAENRGWDAAELKRREASQLPLDEKRKRADDIISNDGSRSELSARARQLLHRILETHCSRRQAGLPSSSP